MPLNIEVKWEHPIELTSNSEHPDRIIDFARTNQEDKIPDKPGVYFFARRDGEKYTPLYIGSTKKSLRTRIGQQFKSASLMKRIQTAKVGTKVLVTGVVISKNQVEAIPIIKNALIKKSVLSGNDEISNIQDIKPKLYHIQLKGNRDVKNLFGSSIEAETEPLIISLPEKFRPQLEQMRKQKNRSHPELVREALYCYFAMHAPTVTLSRSEMEGARRGREQIARGEYTTLEQLQEQLSEELENQHRKEGRKGTRQTAHR